MIRQPADKEPASLYLRQLPPLLWPTAKPASSRQNRIKRALLKRLYLQQSWRELMEEANSLLSRGAKPPAAAGCAAGTAPGAAEIRQEHEA
ncbi:hypothetical protein ACVXG7_04510 [Enterobacter hormaechei]